ncbi:MAG: CHASE domain-containing protein [Pseudomonadota bacterium]
MRTHGYLAFFVGICMTLWGALFVLETQDRQARQNFQRDVDRIARDTGVRLQTYFDVLLSIKGMYAVNPDLGRAQFSRYVRELNVAERYPGFQAIQFVRSVPQADLASFTDAVRRDASIVPGGYPHFMVHPSALRELHWIIEYNEPMRGNENAFGLDLSALAPHRRALELGRDSDKIIATERITLVQDASGQPGFVARVPLYRAGMPQGDVAQRRAALLGFAAIVFRVNRLMREVIDPQVLAHMDITIHDAGLLGDGGAMPPTIDNLMYDSAGKPGAARPASPPGLSASMSLNVGERRWVMRFNGQSGARYSNGHLGAALIAVAGVIISALIGMLLLAAQRRRALSAQLRSTLDEQRALQDSAIVGIGLFCEGVLVRCNLGLEEMLGYAPGELAGCPAALLTGSHGTDPFSCDAQGRRLRIERELLRKDGTPIWCMLNGRVLDADDANKGCVCVISDISERKQAEAALVDTQHGLERSLDELAAQKANAELAHHDLSNVLATLKQAQTSLITSEKMASLGALVAGIAHELNTPIGNSLLTATALSDMVKDFEQHLADGGIKRSALDAHLRDARLACSIIANSLTRAAELITSFKQVAVDQTSDQRRQFNLAGVLRDTLATYAAQLRRINCDVSVEAPDVLEFDSYPGSVSQVVSNLINNAMLHAFEGRGSGSIAIRAQAQDDGTALLEFRDNGVGMSAKTLHQIFDPFFTTKMGQGGSGLGMNIVYNIVTGVLRGTIAIESEPGEGTTITLVLPVSVPRPLDEPVEA